VAGYSGTPLPRKLGIKEGATVLLVNAPSEFEGELEPLPDGVEIARDQVKDGRVDVALLFVTSRALLEASFDAVAKQLQSAGGLWVAWPKRASGVTTDLTEPVVMEVGLAHGLVDNKVCAITDVWSGLRFVVRLVDRPPAGRSRR
jgi:hypothetical protein